MVKVKICGITRLEDALMAAEYGADLIGLNFYRKSPRYLPVEAAVLLVGSLRSALGKDCPTLVGVFVNELVANISLIASQVGLNAAQLAGDESADMLRELRGIGFKTIQPMNMAMAEDDMRYFADTLPTDERLPSLLLDAYHPQLRGGTGDQASVDIALAVCATVPRLMLAGGLTPENVRERIAVIQPWGVDVASGVEDGIPGVKSKEKVRAFIVMAKGL